MGYYEAHMIAVEGAEPVAVRKAIRRYIAEWEQEHEEEWNRDLPVSSEELVARKGGFTVIAGVFNYWSWKNGEDLAKWLAVTLATDVWHTYWNQELDGPTLLQQVWDREGKPRCVETPAITLELAAYEAYAAECERQREAVRATEHRIETDPALAEVKAAIELAKAFWPKPLHPKQSAPATEAQQGE